MKQNGQVLTADEAKGYITTALIINAAQCPTLAKPAFYAIDDAFTRVFTEPFYYKDSLDTCFVALLTSPCPTEEMSDGRASQYYRFMLKMCNPRPFEL